MDWQALKETVMSLYDKLHVTHQEYYHLWRAAILFSWRWWAALSLIVLPWTLWFIVRKRNSTDRLLYAGAIIAILSSFMDAVGVTAHTWSYPTTVFPLMPSYIPFDLSAMPVATMLWLQLFPRMKLVWKTLIYAAAGAFVFEPICIWIGLAVEEGWNCVYTFPILCMLYVIAYWLSNRTNFEKLR